MASHGADTAFLTFSNVKKTYDQQTLVVKDFSLEVARGEFITLLGPSGSGKTTCLMMLAGFEDVTSGEILINGRNITSIPPYRRNIGMVFQQYALFPHMTLRENLAYPLKLRKRPAAEIRARVDEYLALVELQGFAGRYPAQLSGGQRQRVALARALIFAPDIVLMDDVLYTGRTIRAALDALFEHGRPARVQLAVLIDRGWRELPIEARYIGRKIQTAANEIVEVKFQEIDEKEKVLLVEKVED